MSFLSSSELIGKYRVQTLIKSNHYTETYRVEDADHNAYFLKLFVLNRIPEKLVNPNTLVVKEIEYSKQLCHRNVVSYVDSGAIYKESGKLQYYVTNYFRGALLANIIHKTGAMSEEEALAIFRQILAGLKHLHTQNPTLCHNDLDPGNIVVQYTTSGEASLIDLGHLSTECNSVVWFNTSDLNPRYHANETMADIFDISGDLFSACAILYYMITAMDPWKDAFLPYDEPYKSRIKELWLYRKSHDLNIDNIDVSPKVKFILNKGLADNAEDRFADIDEIIDVLNEDESSLYSVDAFKQETAHNHKQDQTDEQSDDLNPIDIEIKRGGGRGFADIAGMQELKKFLQQKVIFVIKNKEMTKRYRLKAPNGLLLYGPPGCGKTYFAEKFAEETGFNFMLVKASDIGSSLVHGSQEKIKKLFNKAANNAPIVLCFDEFDAVVPDRGAHGNEYVASEVNEFLSQMNNCSDRGIFIVATSNRPDKIDPAILRTGRIDKQVYVPLPDFEARKEMFRMYLANRPFKGEVKLDTYAKATEGYIASDIAYIVNDAALAAAFARKDITSELLLDGIRNIRPSLRKENLEEYENIKARMESIDRKNVRA